MRGYRELRSVVSHVTVLFLFVSIQTPWVDTSLHDFTGPNHVNHYEPVLHDSSDALVHSIRTKRSNQLGENDEDNLVDINMYSHGRNFKLRLDVDDEIFHPQAVIENSDGEINYDTRNVLRGHLHGDPESLVQGVLSTSGHFEGYIGTGSGEEFFVEPSEKYWPVNTTRPPGIMYRAEDVKWPSGETESSSSCASHKLHLIRKESDYLNETELPNVKRTSPRIRKKRWTLDPNRKTCMLYLQADHLFYNRFGSEEACINVITGHIQRVNQIYRATDFDMDGEPDDIQFMIKRIKVHTKNRTSDPTYPFDGHFEVIKFLEVFSEGDYDSFCLAYMFTYRDFEGGTLGLAWTGDLKNAGGVCEKKGNFRGGIKSLNTGIITLLNYGKIVAPAVSYVTLAHEIGHNFGSPHDPEGDRVCTPGGEDGNFIMYARATAGDKRNNNRFSQCSLKSINPVINSKARDIYGCFQEIQTSICGNGVVEDGEECDCGWEEDCRESCCFPMRRRHSRDEPPCKLRPGRLCSPSVGPCCTPLCNFKFGDKCRDDNGCRNTAFCDGSGALCPPSVLKPNKTVCHTDSVCFMGECTGSICLAYGLESCQCGQESWERATKLCEVCCKLPGHNQPCVSSYEWNTPPYDVPNMLGKPGTPCRNYTGYCDSYHSCREVDPSGPLATLRKLLSADEGLATIAEWVDNHWYVVLASVALLIILMVMTAKFCGKTAKARLRKLTVMHSNLEAIQIQRTYLEDVNESHTVHPVAVRKKIPFKKKVRERRSRPRNKRSREGKSDSGKSPKSSGGSLWRRSKKRNATSDQPLEMNKHGECSQQVTLDQPLANLIDVPQPLPGPSLQVSTSTAELVNHESKIAIVPHAKDAKRKMRSRRKKSSTKKDENAKHPQASQPPQSKSRKVSSGTKLSNGSGKENSARDSANAATRKPIGGSIQVLYKAPFSIKLGFKQNPSNSSSKTPSNPQVAPGGSNVNGNSKPCGHFSSTSPPSGATTSRHKSSSSLLRRRKGNANNSKYPKSPGKSELQILIPATHEEDESLTPATANAP